MKCEDRPYTIIGGGAIGTTLALALAKNGKSVQVVEAAAERVSALRRGMTVVSGPVSAVPPLDAFVPDETPGGPLGGVLLTTKAQHTHVALRWLEPRLAPDGYVVSCQNGDNLASVAEYVGTDRTVLSMIDIAADVLSPGVLRLGGAMDVVIGEPDGRLSDRVRRLAADLRPTVRSRASDNVRGAIWGKRGLGAILTATALADDHVAALVDAYRPFMAHLLAVVYDTARGSGVELVPVHDCDPNAFGRIRTIGDMVAALDAVVVRFAGSAKDRSGVFRDIAVHRQRTEAHGELQDIANAARRVGVDAGVLLALDAMLTDLELGSRPFSCENLNELARLVT